jgi:glutamate/tyrosine decarboxylase-like PLP-dependent enzyme
MKRKTPIEIDKNLFQKMGYELIDKVAHFMNTIDEKPVTTSKSNKEIALLLGKTSIPVNGSSPDELLSRTTDILMENSLLNGHPKFMGYITSSPAPIGALADLLAATINPNVGAQILSPVATEIEKQTIQWLAEFIGVSPNYGGILVSGGNMANFTGFLAARTAKAPKEIKEKGISNATNQLTVYCSDTTHTWVEKAVILFGLGTDAIRWIPSDDKNKMNISLLEQKIEEDIEMGCIPMIIVGTAGDVSTGSVDNLQEIARVSKKYNSWFHIDGAYGVPAAIVPKYKVLFNGIEDADSIALDPHKWLYSPLEAGCTLVKNPQHLIDTFSSHPEYYNFSNNDHNFYEFGLQNSRGFRALKVWMALKQVGKNGYIEMINEDIDLAKMLFDAAQNHPKMEAVMHNLSIATFRYIPEGNQTEAYLNTLNEELLNELQAGGELFVSNAIINGSYCLRACIVNFRTSKKDIDEMIEIIVREGKKRHLILKNK